jgi:hypothetical protein
MKNRTVFGRSRVIAPNGFARADRRLIFSAGQIAEFNLATPASSP